MIPNIPKDQLKRIEPIVEALLQELRRLTGHLPCDTASAVDYELEPEPPEPLQTQSGAGQ